MSRSDFKSDAEYIEQLEGMLQEVHEYLAEVTCPAAEKQAIRKAGWIETLKDVIRVGVSGVLEYRISKIIRGVERSMAYGSSSRYKQRIVELEKENATLRARPMLIPSKGAVRGAISVVVAKKGAGHASRV